jgi:polyisoprenoid-binding protein YceI
MTPQQLQAALSSAHPPLLIQVLPEEIHQAQHLPGAVNACVFEMSFLDKVAHLCADRNREIILYGAGRSSQDANVALEKLQAACYTHVSVFEDGLCGWRSAGLPLEGSGQPPAEAPLIHGRYVVDTEASVVRWTGQNLFNHHHGTVKLSKGAFTVEDNQLTHAKFTINLRSILCEDIADSSLNALLLRHLMDADFFHVAQHPEASWVLSAAQAIPGSVEGQPNWQLSGQLTLRGVTQPVNFPAVIAASADGQTITGQAHLHLDRTLFGSIYGSGRFFKFLGQHVVNDHIQLHLKIHADKVD